MKPAVVVEQVLYAPATRLVPAAPLPPGEVAFLAQWTPSALASTVPRAAVRALTPQAVVEQLTPAALTTQLTQSLALAAVLAALA